MEEDAHVSAVVLTAVVLIVRDLSPLHRSRLSAILARRTRLPVAEAVDGTAIRRRVIYVAPPDRHLIVEDGFLRLVSAPRVSRSRPPIDVLFHSVATQYGPRAIGVLLSGASDDSARGLQAVRSVGGTTIVQDPTRPRCGRCRRRRSRATVSRTSRARATSGPW